MSSVIPNEREESGFLAMVQNDKPGKLPKNIPEKLKKSFKTAKGAP